MSKFAPWRSWRWHPITPVCVDDTVSRFIDTGQVVPSRAVVHPGVGAVPQHWAEAGVSAGGSALWGRGVLPEETSHTRSQSDDPVIFLFFHACFEIFSSPDIIPYFICDLFLIATLMAAADQEPDEKQEEEKQQESTNHRSNYDTHLVGCWKKGHGALGSNKCCSHSLNSIFSKRFTSDFAATFKTRRSRIKRYL